MTVCFLWGYLLYTGNIESLWRMMGIANQLLAIIALAVGTSYLLLHFAQADLRPDDGHPAGVRRGSRSIPRASRAS